MGLFDDRTFVVYCPFETSYVTIFTPYRIGFINDGEYPAWDIFDNMVDFFYLFDLCLTFFTAFYDEDNKLVTERRKIASNYLKGWFFIDLLVRFRFTLVQYPILLDD